MVVKGSSSTSLGVILTPNEYKEYIHLTQAAKSASISFVDCLSHSSGPWILNSGAFDQLSGNKDFFSSPIITSPLPVITLANGSQTMAKGIGLPFTFIWSMDSRFWSL